MLLSGGIGSDSRGGSVSTIFVPDLEVYSPRALVPAYGGAGVSIDLDDPILDELGAAELIRAPGLEAGSVDAPSEPSRRCDAL